MNKPYIKAICLSSFIATNVAVLLTGCSVPGNYISSSYGVSSSKTNLEGQLLKTSVISIDDNFLYSHNADFLKQDYKYKIGSYDVINVIVWNHPELTSSMSAYTGSNSALLNSNSLDANQTNVLMFSQVTSQPNGLFVDNNGDVMFPLVGPIKIAGLTTNEAQELLTQKLKKYVRYPRVSVQVIAFNSQRTHILGEVVRPGIRPLTDRALTVLDAISLSGGINVNTADVGNIYIIRSQDLRDISVYRLNTKSPQSLLVAERFILHDNDIVYVPPAGIVSWNRVVNQILPNLQTIWYTRSLVRD